VIHPDSELAWYGPTIGHGVRATRAIPRGTIVWVQCALDIVLDPEQAASLGAAYQGLVERYSYMDARGRRIICWDIARYMNHDCETNTRTFGHWGQIAIRDIAAGEHLTCDYGEHNLDWKLTCACGAPTCRSVVRATDLLEFGRVWDQQIAEAVAVARGLDQPLLAFLEPHQRETIAAALLGEGPIPSILEVAFPGATEPAG
jgi:hypothetical protein